MAGKSNPSSDSVHLAKHRDQLKAQLDEISDEIERGRISAKLLEIENTIRTDGWVRSGLAPPD